MDGSKVAEKADTAQPLWITLALQKQKGFREQQATREEKKQAREAKQAEKLSRENVSVRPQLSLCRPEFGSLSGCRAYGKAESQSRSHPAERRRAPGPGQKPSRADRGAALRLGCGFLVLFPHLASGRPGASRDPGPRPHEN